MSLDMKCLSVSVVVEHFGGNLSQIWWMGGAETAMDQSAGRKQ